MCVVCQVEKSIKVKDTLVKEEKRVGIDVIGITKELLLKNYY